MKLSLNVDFDSLEECLEFCTVLQEHFGTKRIIPMPKVGVTTPKASSLPIVQEPVQPEPEAHKASNKTTHPIQHITVPTKPKINNSKNIIATSQPVESYVPTVSGFRPSEEMLSKVKAYIEKGQAFKTQDVVSAKVMENPSRRTRANKWLKGHPNLHFKRSKRESGGGLGPLIYTPLPVGKKKEVVLKSQTVKTSALKKQQTKSTQKLSLLAFRPTTEMQRKVREYLKIGQSFKTQDIVGKAIMSIPPRRAGANRWLQSLPELRYELSKAEKGKGGHGPLIYSPINKVILPPASKPTKTDWPIKGASYKPAFAPAAELLEDEDLYDIPSQDRRQPTTRGSRSDVRETIKI